MAHLRYFAFLAHLRYFAFFFLLPLVCDCNSVSSEDDDGDTSDVTSHINTLTVIPGRTIRIPQGGQDAVVVNLETTDPAVRSVRYSMDELPTGATGTFTSVDGGSASEFPSRLAIQAEPDLAPGVYLCDVIASGSSGELLDSEEMLLEVVPVGGAIRTAAPVAISAGWRHSLAILEDGTVWAWGENREGRIGDGTTTGRLAPVHVDGVENARAVAAGELHSVAVDAQGRVWTWGSRRALGSDADTSSFTLVQVVSLPRIVSIAAGRHHSLALDEDGRVWAWGDNYAGQIGDGTTDDQSLPFVLSLSNIVAIAAGSGHSLALHASGTVWAWGDNFDGQLGFSESPDPDRGLGNDLIPHPIARVIPELHDIQQIAAGFSHSVAVDTAGRVWTWGTNEDDQLGTEARADGRPVQVPDLLPVRAASAGWEVTAALLRDGSVMTWGQISRTLGRRGSSAPGTVPNLDNVRAISVGGRHTLALLEDCSLLRAWGSNGSGQLGDGTRQSRTDHVQVDGIGEAESLAGCQVDLTVVRIGEGAVSFVPDGTGADALSRAFDPGTTVTVEAVAEEGWLVDGWEGDCAASDRDPSVATVTMDGSRNCFAVFSQPPTADFDYSPDGPEAEQMVTFDAGESRDDAYIIGYLWDYGDDTPPGEGETPDHTFLQPGTYTVTLTVTDLDGYEVRTTRTVLVSERVEEEPEEDDVPPAEEEEDSGTYTLTIRYLGGGEGTVYVEPLGLSCTEDCTFEIPSGEQVIVSASAAEGDEHVYTDGCDPGSGPTVESCPILMDRDREVTVHIYD